MQPLESIYAKIEEMLALGGNGRVAARRAASGSVKSITMKICCGSIHERYPQAAFALFSAPEILLLRGSFGTYDWRHDWRLREACLHSILAAARKFGR